MDSNQINSNHVQWQWAYRFAYLFGSFVLFCLELTKIFCFLSAVDVLLRVLSEKILLIHNFLNFISSSIKSVKIAIQSHIS